MVKVQHFGHEWSLIKNLKKLKCRIFEEIKAEFSLKLKMPNDLKGRILIRSLKSRGKIPFLVLKKPNYCLNDNIWPKDGCRWT